MKLKRKIPNNKNFLTFIVWHLLSAYMYIHCPLVMCVTSINGRKRTSAQLLLRVFLVNKSIIITIKRTKRIIYILWRVHKNLPRYQSDRHEANRLDLIYNFAYYVSLWMRTLYYLTLLCRLMLLTVKRNVFEQFNDNVINTTWFVGNFTSISVALPRSANDASAHPQT